MRNTIHCFVSCACALAAFAASAAAPVPVSSFGYDPEDATACFQKALDSDEPKLVVDFRPGGWNVGPLKLTRPNLELVLAPGVVVRAKKGAFIDRNRHMVDCSGYLICFLREDRGGTAYTVRYAEKAGLEVVGI